jgi:hypothetical protein
MNAQRQRERDIAAWLARILDPGSPQAIAAAAAFLLTFYVGLALAYRDAIPLFEAPDEPSHLHYAAFVYENERLPRQRPMIEVPGRGDAGAARVRDRRAAARRIGIDVAWAAREIGRAMSEAAPDPKAKDVPAIRRSPHSVRVFATDGRLEGLRVARSTSLVFGLLTVIFTFAAVWRLSRDARFALLAGSLVAFDPQFLFTSGYFSNDAAAAAIGAAALWIVVRALEEPRGPARGHYLAGGVLIALGALTKTPRCRRSPSAAVALISIDSRERRLVAIDTALAAACVAVLAGPYAIWALEHRGGFLGVNAVVASAVNMARPDRYGGLISFLTTIYWDSTFESFWARFGWFNVIPPKAVLPLVLRAVLDGTARVDPGPLRPPARRSAGPARAAPLPVRGRSARRSRPTSR